MYKHTKSLLRNKQQSQTPVCGNQKSYLEQGQKKKKKAMSLALLRKLPLLLIKLKCKAAHSSVTGNCQKGITVPTPRMQVS